MMSELVYNDEYKEFDLPRKLIISGVNGNAGKMLIQQIEQMRLRDYILLSGFVSNSERNALYKNAYSFLFPSLFEGFGMPPVEAMYLGTPVVTTRCASIPEVTQNKATYVDNPCDATEWIAKVYGIKRDFESPDYSEYDASMLAKKYLRALME